MEGVEKRRDGRYRIRGEYRDPRTGKRHEIDRIVAADSAAAAASVRAKLLAERTAGRGDEKPDRTTLADALAAWKRGKVLTLRPSTADRYGTAIEKWTKAIGPYFLSQVRPDDVREVLMGWRDNDRATETINGRLRVLRTFAKEARVPWIVEGVRAMPSTAGEIDEDEGRGLTLEELQRLIAAGPTARKTKLGRIPRNWPRAWALVATLAWTGLRFGEASALRWSDVDLDGQRLYVRRAQWRGIIGHPKAKASKRVVPIDAVAETLREHREAMVRWQLPGVDSDLVFPSRIRGKSIVANTHARKAMLACCTAAKIDLAERPALHALRHTINNLVRQHASEAVRRAIIGHADEVRTYTHVEIEEQRAAMGAVVRLVRGGA